MPDPSAGMHAGLATQASPHSANTTPSCTKLSSLLLPSLSIRILPIGLKVSVRAHSNRRFQGKSQVQMVFLRTLPSFYTEDVGEAPTTGDSANLPLSKFFKDQEWGYNVLTGKDSFIATYKDAKT